MTNADERALFLEALFALRDPLSRIAMASSSAPRFTSPSEGARHLELMQCALAELDARIDDLVSALAPRRSEALEPSEDCRAAFALACRRAAIAARAREVELAVRAAPEPIAGDASLVRRAVLRVLRVACAWTGGSGRVEIELASAGAAPVLRCRGTRGSGAARAAPLRDLLARFALAAGAHVVGLDSFAHDALSLEIALPSVRPAP